MPAARLQSVVNCSLRRPLPCRSRYNGRRESGPQLAAPGQFQRDTFLNALRDLLQQPGVSAPLDRPALELAQLEFPHLQPEPYLCLLDEWILQLRQGPIDSLQGESFLREFHGFFFDELGFHGNEQDYFNPMNSFLNEVMDRRTGIPITLSLLYMELARRLGRTVHGISFPGHFLVLVDDAQLRVYVDVFNRGRQMTQADCLDLGFRLTGIDYSSRPEVLFPVDSRTILIRMLNNLRGIYITRKSNRRLLQVLDLLLLADPSNAGEYFTRAMVKMNLHLHSSAERDLLHFLKLSPSSDLQDEVKRQLELARLMRSQLN